MVEPKKKPDAAQVQAFRELAAKIATPDSRARFEEALGTLLQSKEGAKRRPKASVKRRDDGPGVVPAVQAKAPDRPLLPASTCAMAKKRQVRGVKCQQAFAGDRSDCDGRGSPGASCCVALDPATACWNGARRHKSPNGERTCRQ